MYNPVHFREERTEVLHDLIRRHSLATLVTVDSDGLCANHIPMILHPGNRAPGILRGHVARANPDWVKFNGESDALAIFQGPAAYITPSWYPSKREHGKVVPTYNYMVVHARGRLKMFDDPALLASHLRALTSLHESRFADHWSVDDAPADFIEGMLKGIVGVELAISRLEGKWKVSQNRSIADRAGASDGLRSLGDSVSIAVAEAIAEETAGQS